MTLAEWQVAATQKEAASALAEEWQIEIDAAPAPATPAPATPQPSTETTEPERVQERFLTPDEFSPPVIAAAEEGEVFALLRVPRFGDDYVRPIAEGVSLEEVLNRSSLGVGKYPESNLLGEAGNFAIAAHRRGFGGSFRQLVDFQVGDSIYIEVESGWYVYEFRNLEYVWPTAIDVLNSFPRIDVSSPTERLITLTTCNPEFSTDERVIAYGVYRGWYPRESGIPRELIPAHELAQ